MSNSNLGEDTPQWSRPRERDEAVDAVLAMLEQMQVTKTVTQQVAGEVDAAWEMNGRDPRDVLSNGTF